MLMLLIIWGISVLVTRFILIRVGGHETLDRNEDRLQSLSRRPLFSTVGSPSTTQFSTIYTMITTNYVPENRPASCQSPVWTALACQTHKQTFPCEYILGLNLHRPPLVVVAVTDGSLSG